MPDDQVQTAIDKADEADWLNPDIVESERLLTLLKPYATGKMEEWHVGDEARNSKNDYPELIKTNSIGE
jgi:putative SOS response-associated peptidase YedK